MSYKKNKNENKIPGVDEVNYDFIVPLIILGDSSVGKTSLLKKFLCSSNPLQTKSTLGTNIRHLKMLGIEMYIKIINLNERAYKIHICDTSGQEQFQSMTSNYYRNSLGCLLAFDPGNAFSFSHLSNWISQITTNAMQDNFPIVIISTKWDIYEEEKKLQEVSDEQIKEFIEEYEISYFKTSSKTGQGISEAIRALTSKAVEQYQLKNSTIRISKTKSFTKLEKKKSCC